MLKGKNIEISHLYTSDVCFQNSAVGPASQCTGGVGGTQTRARLPRAQHPHQHGLTQQPLRALIAVPALQEDIGGL